ncbi:MAG: SRPBCC family protein [Acidimicrobiales bacterium]
MASVIKEVLVDAPAARCWASLRDFGAVHERLARGFVSTTTIVGESERELTFFTGAVARERLVGLDDGAMRLAYTVYESPIPSDHHNASAQIVPVSDSQCSFVWITDVLPDDQAARIGELMSAGLRAIKETLESGA